MWVSQISVTLLRAIQSKYTYNAIRLKNISGMYVGAFQSLAPHQQNKTHVHYPWTPDMYYYN